MIALTAWWGRTRYAFSRMLRRGAAPSFHSVFRETLSAQRRASQHAASDEFEATPTYPRS